MATINNARKVGLLQVAKAEATSMLVPWWSGRLDNVSEVRTNWGEGADMQLMHPSWGINSRLFFFGLCFLYLLHNAHVLSCLLYDMKIWQWSRIWISICALFLVVDCAAPLTSLSKLEVARWLDLLRVWGCNKVYSLCIRVITDITSQQPQQHATQHQRASSS